MLMPGDKSISHRAAMFSALADGTTSIKNFSSSTDCAATISCLEALGVVIERDDKAVLINGVGVDGLREPQAPLDCGNSGTTMRLLSGILSGQGCKSNLTSDESLRSRSIERDI